MEGETVNRLAQPYHFTVKTFAERYDGRKPFTVEISMHLSISDIDNLDQEGSPYKVGMEKIIKDYENRGYSHLAGLPVDVKPAPKK